MTTPPATAAQSLLRPVAMASLLIILAVPASPVSAQTGGVYYKYCSHARAAGAAPIRRGQPGYGAHLDRDGDGIACEPYKGGSRSPIRPIHTKRRR